ncbi:MAG: CorA family divalent cation transporter [Pseudomonadota bacterium]
MATHLPEISEAAASIDPDFDGMRHRTADAAVWVDLVSPSHEKLAAIEAQVGVEIPSDADLRHAPSSRRLYEQNAAHFMSCELLICAGKRQPEYGELLLVLTNTTLVSVRYRGLSAFRLLEGQTHLQDFSTGAPEPIAVGLMEAIVAREADLIHRLEDHTDILTKQVFDARGKEIQRERRHSVAIKDIGRLSLTISRAEKALPAQVRLLTYLRAIINENGQRALDERIGRLLADLDVLMDSVARMVSRVGFLLDATMGLVGIEQNQIMKVFTIATAAFMPPAILAGVWGMNFADMPELSLPGAYPVALLAIVISSLTPIVIFKRLGWL